jgi:epoxyqueuosine reductase
MVRNAAIAAGNSGDPRLLARLQALVGDEDSVVAEAATWAIGKLSA